MASCGLLRLPSIRVTPRMFQVIANQIPCRYLHTAKMCQEKKKPYRRDTQRHGAERNNMKRTIMNTTKLINVVGKRTCYETLGEGENDVESSVFHLKKYRSQKKNSKNSSLIPGIITHIVHTITGIQFEV